MSQSTLARQRDAAARAAAGRAARRQAPLESHADLDTGPGRADPLAILADQDASRVPELVPIRWERMGVSPFAYLRGAAAVMASDLAATPVSGITVQACGDAHLLNFGMYASPERRLVFDVNDFDETAPGPWEWDVKRLAASLATSARENGYGRKVRHKIVHASAKKYREAMAQFAAMRELDVWYANVDVDELRTLVSGRLGRRGGRKVAKMTSKARGKDSMQAFRKLTTLTDGERRIVADPPLIVPVGDMLPEMQRAKLEERVKKLFGVFRKSLAGDRQHLFDAFEFVDMARKVVGVGSVGTRCWIVLMTGRDHQDPLILQVKEAGESVIDSQLKESDPWPDGQGRRVVEGQRLMQASSDIFLGWATVGGIDGRERDFYVRQLRDWKGSVEPSEMVPEGLKAYGELCGWTLARAHARTGDRIAIAAYLGEGNEFDHAIAEFGERYADLAESDYAALVKRSNETT
jgi:uncharacterized protein (DUF2252 family)